MSEETTVACVVCETARVDKEIAAEELGMCLECSDEYWSHDDE